MRDRAQQLITGTHRSWFRRRRNLMIPLGMAAALVMVFGSALPASAAIPPPTVSKRITPSGASYKCTLSAKSLGYTAGPDPTSNPGYMRYQTSMRCPRRTGDFMIMVTGAYFKKESSQSSWTKFKKKFDCGSVFYCAVTIKGPYFGNGIYCAYAYEADGIGLVNTHNVGPACVKLG